MKRTRTIRYAVVIIIAVVIAWFPTGYYCMFPGDALNLSDVVTGGTYQSETSFHMTTVTLVKANLPVLLYGYLSSNARVMSAEELMPNGWEEDEYNYYSKYQMQESHNNAMLALASLLSLPYDETLGHVKVVRVIDGSAVEGILDFGDIIMALDGQEMKSVAQTVSYLSTQRPGDKLTCTVKRQDEQLNVDITLGIHPDDSNRAFMGVTLINDQHSVSLMTEDQVVIETGRITGPSAGLMLTLELVNKFTENDLAQGYLIGGTGTIDANGSVGIIGGINQKLVTAHRAGMQIFFLPKNNLSDITIDPQKYEGMTLVPVETLAEAIDYLIELHNDQRMTKILALAV